MASRLRMKRKGKGSDVLLGKGGCAADILETPVFNWAFGLFRELYSQEEERSEVSVVKVPRTWRCDGARLSVTIDFHVSVRQNAMRRPDRPEIFVQAAIELDCVHPGTWHNNKRRLQAKRVAEPLTENAQFPVDHKDGKRSSEKGGTSQSSGICYIFPHCGRNQRHPLPHPFVPVG